MSNSRKIGNNVYLPDENPPLPKLLIFAIQQVLVMFPPTATVALITGFPVSTTIFSCGLATICFIMITRGQVPLFFGSSFAYLSAIIGIIIAQGYESGSGILPVEAVRVAQFGIMMSGLVSVAAGLIAKALGPQSIQKLLPAHITGSISIVIGLSLAGNALTDITDSSQFHNLSWTVAMLTFLSTVLFAVYCKGIPAQAPLLLGALIGCSATALILWLSGGEQNLFRSISNEVFANSLWKLGDGSAVSLPPFSLPKVSLEAALAIMPIAFATIPESVAHIYQLDIYVNELARESGSSKRFSIKEKLADTLIGDGCSDIICGIIGAPAGTSYGENMSAMMISKVFSTSVLVVASILLIFLSCVTPLVKIIYGIPLAVIGGLEIYLFGAIAIQGVAVMIQSKCDVFSNRRMAVIASILVIGIGGTYAFDGSIPFFGMDIPAIAGASVFGILLNWLLGFKES